MAVAPVAAAKTAEQLETEREIRRAQTTMATKLTQTAKPTPTATPTQSTSPTAQPASTTAPTTQPTTAPTAQPTGAPPTTQAPTTPQATPSPSPNARPVPVLPPTVPTAPQVDERREAIESAAANYKPSAPKVTVNTPATRKVAPVITTAEKDKTKAQTAIDADNAAITATRAQLTNIYDNGDPRRAKVLEDKLAKQEAQLKKDQAALAVADSTIAAGKVVTYSEQARHDTQVADKSATAANKARTNLTRTLPKGMKLTNDQLTPTQIASLTPEQRAAYDTYQQARIAAGKDAANVNADLAAVDENYTVIQTHMNTTTGVTVNKGDSLIRIAGESGTPMSFVYGTNPQFDPGRQDGRLTTGADRNGRDPDLIHPGETVTVSAGGRGVAIINEALGPQFNPLPAPKIVPQNVADENLRIARENANYFNAVRDKSTTAVTALEAENRVNAADLRVTNLQSQITAWENQNRTIMPADAALKQQLAEAQTNAAAERERYKINPSVLDYNVQATYVQKLETAQDVRTAETLRAQVQNRFDAWRTANPKLPAEDNPYAADLAKAQTTETLARQRADAVDAAFVGAFATRYAVQQGTPAEGLTERQLAEANYDWQQSRNKTTPSPYQAVLNAHTAEEAAKVLNAEADTKVAAFETAAARYDVKLQEDNLAAAQVSRKPAAIAQATNDLNLAKQRLSDAQAQETAARYAEGQYKYFITLPANLQQPKTPEDEEQLKIALEGYDRQQTLTTTPGGKADLAAAKKVVSADLAAETKKLDSRGWMQSSSDAVVEAFGGDRSELEVYLQDKQQALNELESQRGRISENEFQTRLDAIMAGYGGSVATMSAGEAKTDGNWNTANGYVRGAVAITAGLAVTAVAGPVAGAAVAFGTFQAWDLADDATAAINGGDIGADGHVSLMGLGGETVAAATGNADWGQVGNDAKIAGIDVVTEGISSLTAGYGGALAKPVSTAVSSRILTAGGNQVVARVTGNAAGYSSAQLLMGGGNVANTAIIVGADKNMSDAERKQAVLRELGNQAVYTLGAPLIGGAAGRAPAGGLRGVTAQSAVNLTGNVTQEEVRALVVDGRNASGVELFGATTASVPGTVLANISRPNAGTIGAPEAPATQTGGADGTPPGGGRTLRSPSPAEEPNPGNGSNGFQPTRVFSVGKDGVAEVLPVSGEGPYAPPSRVFSVGADGVAEIGYANPQRVIAVAADGVAEIQPATGAIRLPTKRRITIEQSVEELKAKDNPALSDAASSIKRNGKLTIKTTDDISSKKDQDAIRAQLTAQGFTHIRFEPARAENADNAKLNELAGLSNSRTTNPDRNSYNTITARKIAARKPLFGTIDDARGAGALRLRLPILDALVPNFMTGGRPSDSSVTTSGPTAVALGGGVGTKFGPRLRILSARLWEFKNMPAAWLVGFSSQKAYQIKGAEFPKAVEAAIAGKGESSPFNVEVLGAKEIGVDEKTGRPVVELTLGFSLKASGREAPGKGERDAFGARGKSRELTHGLPVSKAMNERKVGIPFWVKAKVAPWAMAKGFNLSKLFPFRFGGEQRPETPVSEFAEGTKVTEPFYRQVQESLRQVAIKTQVVPNDASFVSDLKAHFPHFNTKSGKLTLDMISNQFDTQRTVTYIPRGWKSGLRLSVVDTKEPLQEFQSPTGETGKGWNGAAVNHDIIFNKATTLDYWLSRAGGYQAKRAIALNPLSRRLRENTVIGRRLLTAQPHYMRGRDANFFKAEEKATGNAAARVTMAASPLDGVLYALLGKSPALMKVGTSEVRGAVKTTGATPIRNRVRRRAGRDADPTGVAAPRLKSVRQTQQVDFKFTDANGREMTAKIPRWLRDNIRKGRSGIRVLWPTGGREQLVNALKAEASGDPARLQAIDQFDAAVLSQKTGGEQMTRAQIREIIDFLETQASTGMQA